MTKENTGTWADAVRAHDEALLTGGASGILSRSAVESAIARPYQGLPPPHPPQGGGFGPRHCRQSGRSQRVTDESRVDGAEFERPDDRIDGLFGEWDQPSQALGFEGATPQAVSRALFRPLGSIRETQSTGGRLR